MNKNKFKFISLLLFLFSSILPIFIADLILKNLRLPKDSSRLMLLAGSSLYSVEDGYKRYESNKNIEQLAIHKNKIAYRYSYKTNNKGLVSYPDLEDNDDVNLVSHGDSLGEGVGGFPWIVEWQKNELKNLNILSVNYSIAGNGFVDFLKSSTYSKKNHNNSKNIIFFVESDAYKQYFKMSKNDHCSFYSKGKIDNFLGPLTCKTYNIVWHHIDVNESDDQILEKANYLRNYGVLASSMKLMRTLKRSYNSYKNSEKKKEDFDYLSPEVTLRFGEIPSYTKNAIKKINKLYDKKEILFVQLPD